jgi:hypothetical protein
VRRTASWKIADILDFECLLARDRTATDGDLRARDQALGETILRSSESREQRPVAMRAWLESRRAEITESLPGRHFTTVCRWLLLSSGLAGIIIGASLAATLLHYQGQEPINAYDFWLWTLGPQLFLLLLVLLCWIDRRTVHLWDRLAGDWRPIHELISGATSLIDATLRRFSGENRNRLRADLAHVIHRQEIYGGLSVWPVIIVTQVFAVAYNLGILGALLGLSAGRELRFGWQTTWDIPSETAAALVHRLAFFWQWLPHSQPDAGQVIATRYIPGQPHSTLPGEAMRAWWPFLFYSVAFYGLALRGTLLLVAIRQLRRALDTLPFDHAEVRALWRRMCAPNPEGSPERAHLTIPPTGALEPPKHHAGSCVALASQDLSLDEGLLRGFLAQTLGWTLQQVVPVKIDQRRTVADVLATLKPTETETAGIAVVIPAERDPIVAIALFLKEVVAGAGDQCEVVLVLRGSAALAEQKQVHWRNFMAIHQLHFDVILWTT